MAGWLRAQSAGADTMQIPQNANRSELLRRTGDGPLLNNDHKGSHQIPVQARSKAIVVTDHVTIQHNYD